MREERIGDKPAGPSAAVVALQRNSGTVAGAPGGGEREKGAKRFYRNDLNASCFQRQLSREPRNSVSSSLDASQSHCGMANSVNSSRGNHASMLRSRPVGWRREHLGGSRRRLRGARRAAASGERPASRQQRWSPGGGCIRNPAVKQEVSIQHNCPLKVKVVEVRPLVLGKRSRRTVPHPHPAKYS